MCTYKFQDKEQSDTVTNKPRPIVSPPSQLQPLGISTFHNPMACIGLSQANKTYNNHVEDDLLFR